MTDKKARKNNDYRARNMVDRHLRFNKDDYEKIKNNAEKAGLSIPKYLAYVGTKGQLTYKYSDEKAEEIDKNVTSLHRNFNQYNVQMNRLLGDLKRGGYVSKTQVNDVINSVIKLRKQVSYYTNLVNPNVIPEVKNDPYKPEKIKQSIIPDYASDITKHLFDSWQEDLERLEKAKQNHEDSDYISLLQANANDSKQAYEDQLEFDRNK